VHRAVERELFAGAWERGRENELQFGAEEADPSRPVSSMCGRSTSRPALSNKLMCSPSRVTQGLLRSARYCALARARKRAFSDRRIRYQPPA